MQRFKDRERPAVLIGPRDRLFPQPQENSAVTSESGGAPFSPPPPTTTRDQRGQFACGSLQRPKKGVAPLVPSQQCGPLSHSMRAGLIAVECSQRPPGTDCQPEEGEEESLSVATLSCTQIRAASPLQCAELSRRERSNTKRGRLKMVPPVDERHDGLTMRQQSESTLQAPAASEDSNRPSPSPPSTARRPSRALCVPHSTRNDFTHIDHYRRNNFALRLYLADVPPLLDATLQLPLDDVLSLLDASP
ncbi:hypothetical protein AAVH_26008 [Aphelenchoides avenae]|nr:hypothetical protein AAVH_26008 [Aphelenchus avenae]